MSAASSLSLLLSRLGRLVLRVGLWAVAAIAIASLLVVSLGLLLLGLLRALITGQRPQPMMKFKFQNFGAYRGNPFGQHARPTPDESDPTELPAREASMSARAPRRHLGAQSDGIVDVQAREIPDK